MGCGGEGGLSAGSGQSTLSVFMISVQFNGQCNSRGCGQKSEDIFIYGGEVSLLVFFFVFFYYKTSSQIVFFQGSKK